MVTGRGLDPGRGEEVYDMVTIGRDRLTASASNRLEDVLRDVPGFHQFRRSDARSANPTSQGATLRALGGNASSRALLILDGVPQSDPFGGWIAWPAFDPRRLGEVRVVRGGGTGANGPGALAGTIELTSAAPADVAGAAASLAYGSRDSLDAFAGFGVPLGAGFLSLSGSFARGDGFVPVVAAQRGPVDRPSPYEQASLAVRAVTPLTAASSCRRTSPPLPTRASAAPRSARSTRGARTRRCGWSGAGPCLFAALVYVQVRDFANAFAAVGAGRATVTQTLDQYFGAGDGDRRPGRAAAAHRRRRARIGADWRDTEGRTQELFQFAAGAPTRGRVAGGRTRTLGGFAELGWTRGDVTLSAGGRVDRWSIADGRLRERVLATGALLTDAPFPTAAAGRRRGRAGVAWRPAEGLSLRAAAYRGWRLPTLNELYRPFRVGADATAANAALAPERLEGVEAGLEYRPCRRCGSASRCSRTGSRTRSRTSPWARGRVPFPASASSPPAASSASGRMSRRSSAAASSSTPS